MKNNICLFLVLVLLTLPFVFGNANNNLVLYMPFEDSFEDLSGYSNNGINHGTSFVQGIIGKSIDLDGQSYVEIEDSENLRLGDTYTISLFLNPDIVDTWRPVLEKGQPGKRYMLWLFKDRINGIAHRETDLPESIDISIPRDQWTYITYTFDYTAKPQVKAYVNGEKIKIINNDLFDHTPDIEGVLKIGNSIVHPTYFFDGQIDEVKIWNKVLNQNEIKAEYQNNQQAIDCMINGNIWTGTRCCTENDLYNDPGEGHGCCYLGRVSNSNELIEELTFLCVDGVWYYSGFLGESGPAWSTNTELCKQYGEYSKISSGTFGPSAPEENYTKREKYLMYGSSENLYCGENMYCNENQECVSCPSSNSPCTNQMQQKEIFAFYFYWYDVGETQDLYDICGPVYDSTYGYNGCNDPSLVDTCSELSVLERVPIYGNNDYINWNNKEMYKSDFIRMKRSGIDVAVLTGWPLETLDLGALPYINLALNELKNQGKEYPKLALFEALDNWIYHYYPVSEGVIDFYDPGNRTFLINKMADRVISVWDNLDEDFIYYKDGKKVLWLFRPPIEFDTKINCLFLDEFKQTLNNRGEEVLIVSPSSMGNCDSIDAYHTWGQGHYTREDQRAATAPAKYISDKIDVCEVSPGFERNNAILCGQGSILENLPQVPRQEGQGFIDSWNYCLENNEGWIVVQTWNEYFESTNIAPSLEDLFLFNEINVQKVNEFKGTNIEWIECEIDEECFVDGEQGECINNECVMPQGCIPDWQCSLDINCLSGEKTSECIDLNNCNNPNIPIVKGYCTYEDIKLNDSSGFEVVSQNTEFCEPCEPCSDNELKELELIENQKNTKEDQNINTQTAKVDEIETKEESEGQATKTTPTLVTEDITHKPFGFLTSIIIIFVFLTMFLFIGTRMYNNQNKPSLMTIEKNIKELQKKGYTREQIMEALERNKNNESENLSFLKD